jgi:protein-tyrosine phosphatase
MTKVLFVCMGNICRSPAAEGALKALLQTHNLSHLVYCESAGTSAHHVGELPDERMRAHAVKRGLILESRARQFQSKDFERFDLIITMDHANYRNVLRLDPSSLYREKVIPMAHLCAEMNITEVPDPYCGGDEGFEQVLDIVFDGGRGLLVRLGLLKHE